MVSRMDKYHSNPTKSIHSRSEKNEHLYENLYNNKIFTEFTNIEDDNIIDLSNISSSFSLSRREKFQKDRLLNSDGEKSKQYTSFNKINSSSLTPSLEEKNYNINDILENARKNRTGDDELEKRRHLKTVEYNILSDLSQEKLKEYHDRKQKLSKDEEENLEELIHTITSNSLRKKIDDELLGDLLPTEESETIVSKQLLEAIEEKQIENGEEIEENQIDKSFYTKSMDLSEEDFDFDEEDRSFLEENKMKISTKLLISLFVVIVISIVAYVVYRFI